MSSTCTYFMFYIFVLVLFYLYYIISKAFLICFLLYSNIPHILGHVSTDINSVMCFDIDVSTDEWKIL